MGGLGFRGFRVSGFRGLGLRVYHAGCVYWFHKKLSGLHKDTRFGSVSVVVFVVALFFSDGFHNVAMQVLSGFVTLFKLCL